MDIYSSLVYVTDNLFERIYYGIISLARCYDRKILAGINVINFSSKKVDLLKKFSLKSGVKTFLFTDLPLSVFSFVSKSKMCDVSVSIEYKGGKYHITVFSGSGYPVNSYQKKLFFSSYYNPDFKPGSGELDIIKSDYCIKRYIKHIFGKKNVEYIKNAYSYYYFKVNGNYYVLNKKFSEIVNIDKSVINDRLSKICKEKYFLSDDDEEFDIYGFMLSRKISCLFTRSGSIIFSNSYYIDYLKVIYYLEYT